MSLGTAKEAAFFLRKSVLESSVKEPSLIVEGPGRIENYSTILKHLHQTHTSMISFRSYIISNVLLKWRNDSNSCFILHIITFIHNRVCIQMFIYDKVCFSLTARDVGHNIVYKEIRTVKIPDITSYAGIVYARLYK